MSKEQKASRRNFKKNTGTVHDSVRTTIMTLTLSTFGTREQVDQSVQKIKDELALQGLRVEISDVQTT